MLSKVHIFSIEKLKLFHSFKVKIIYPILSASFAVACAGLSIMGLLLGSWYLYQQGTEDSSKRWLIAIFLTILFVCMYMRIVHEDVMNMLIVF